MTKDKSLIQSCVDHINTAVDVDPWAKELVIEMGAEILKQLNNSNESSLTQKTLDVPDTNVGDLISRQVAIDICHKNYDGILDFRSDGRTVASSFEDIINSVPSVQPEPQWIPCSERLPEDKTAYYLATVANRGFFFTTTVNNNVDCVRWDYDRRKGQDSWHWCTERTVIAWMPLPEPYQEEGE